ncbi:MAG: hypothetical protein AAFR04_00265 [Pseudomonadota bacterium]
MGTIIDLFVCGAQRSHAAGGPFAGAVHHNRSACFDANHLYTAAVAVFAATFWVLHSAGESPGGLSIHAAHPEAV